MSDKYMKEIEEILKQADSVLPKNRSRPPSSQTISPGRSPSPLSRVTGGRGLSVSAAKLMLASLGLLLLALILGAAKLGFVVPLVVAGLVLFVISYALFFIRPGSSSYEKRWRGRPIEERLSLWGLFRRWLQS